MRSWVFALKLRLMIWCHWNWNTCDQVRVMKIRSWGGERHWRSALPTHLPPPLSTSPTLTVPAVSSISSIHCVPSTSTCCRGEHGSGEQTHTQTADDNTHQAQQVVPEDHMCTYTWAPVTIIFTHRQNCTDSARHPLTCTYLCAFMRVWTGT